MPYIGLTDVKMRFPVTGHLHKGSAKRIKTGQDGRPIVSKKTGQPITYPGANLDYFRYTSEYQPKSVDVFAEVYGEQPRSLTVLLPYQELDDNWDAWGYEFVASRMIHKCDGKFVHYYYDRKLEKGVAPPYGEVPCPGGCKPSGTLSVILPELMKAGYVGTVKLNITSERDIRNISATLQYYYSLNSDLRGIEFQLFRYQFNAPTADGKRRKQWFVGLAANPSWVTNQIAAPADRSLQLTDTVTTPEGEYIDAETGEIVPGDETVEGDEAIELGAPQATPEPPVTAGYNDDDGRAEQSPAIQKVRAPGGPFADEPRNNPQEAEQVAVEGGGSEQEAKVLRTRSLTGFAQQTAVLLGLKTSEVVKDLKGLAGTDKWPYDHKNNTFYLQTVRALHVKAVGHD